MLKKIVLALAAIIVIIVGVGLLLPAKIDVNRDIVIDAPAADVFAVVNRLDRMNEWSPWHERDPDANYVYEGPEGGVGQKVTWSSENDQVGSGTQEIIQSIEDQFVRTALDFGEMGTGTAAFELIPEGDTTKVVWSLQADMGVNPINRYFGLMMDKWVGADYERGLANLKSLIEGQ